jgi:hypothetical protein
MFYSFNLSYSTSLSIDSSYTSFNINFDNYSLKTENQTRFLNSKVVTFSTYELTETSLIESTNAVSNNLIEVVERSYPYPNPSNPDIDNTYISYKLSKSADVTIYLFNQIGRLVKKSDYLSGSLGAYSGRNDVPFDGLDNFGDKLSNGVYIYYVVSGRVRLTQGKLGIIR